MKKSVILFLVFIAFGVSAKSQDQEISKFDVYGCWVLEQLENNIIKKIRIYKRCEDLEPKNTIRHTKISLLAFGESEH